MRGSWLATAVALPALCAAKCLSSGDQNTINNLFKAGGAGTKVQICQNVVFGITGTITFTADGQEISTEGYPMGDARAIIQIIPGHGVTQMILGSQNNLRILNIQFDGNRPNAGIEDGGGANIEMGRQGHGQLIQYVASRNPTSWSCLHIMGSGNDKAPCSNNTVRDNDIGPCGNEGRNAAGKGQWADGISLDCTASLVQNNTITGPTDGGIVVFGSPGSVVDGNRIISSETDAGFGAINMVDAEYNGSYDGVVISNNIIEGRKLFHVGIAMGAYTWSFNEPFYLKGPVTITGNVFKGHVPFSIAINGWQDGLNITGNDVSGITQPRSSFSDVSTCVQGIKDLFQQPDANLVYFPAGVLGATHLQSDFVAADANITNFLCSTTPLPDEIAFDRGLSLTKNAVFAQLNGVVVQYQSDGNFAWYDSNKKVLWASGGNVHPDCNDANGFDCNLQFSEDGNFATFYQGGVRFTTNTAGRGQQLIAMNSSPWFKIVGLDGKTVWDTQQGLVPLPDELVFERGLNLSAAGTIAAVNGTSLIFEDNGNLVVKNASGSVLWNANGAVGDGDVCQEDSESACNVAFDETGNLATYHKGVSLWSANTGGGRGQMLKVQSKSPYVLVLGDDGSTVWDSQKGLTSTMPKAVTFGRGLSFTSAAAVATLDGYSLQYQVDGNLVQYSASGAVEWASNKIVPAGCSSGSDFTCAFSFNETGELATYWKRGELLWSAGTQGRGHTFRVQDSPPWLVVYAQDGSVVWQGAQGVTAPQPTELVFEQGYSMTTDGNVALLDGCSMLFQADGNLVLYSNSDKSVLWAANVFLPGGGCQSSDGTFHCELSLNTAGVLATYHNGEVLWSVDTQGQGYSVKFLSTLPYIEVHAEDGSLVWDAKQGFA